jgi:hypothetical protein
VLETDEWPAPRVWGRAIVGHSRRGCGGVLQQYVAVPVPDHEQVSTVVPDAFRRYAVSPVLFQTYQDRL